MEIRLKNLNEDTGVERIKGRFGVHALSLCQIH